MKLIRMSTWVVMTLMIFNCAFWPARAVLAEPARETNSVPVKLVSINKASAEELQGVRGIGPSLAERIVQYRQTNGGFKSLDQLKEVRGIGDLKFEKIKNQITI